MCGASITGFFNKREDSLGERRNHARQREDTCDHLEANPLGLVRVPHRWPPTGSFPRTQGPRSRAAISRGSERQPVSVGARLASIAGVERLILFENLRTLPWEPR
jgi:hypothetical protein